MSDLSVSFGALVKPLAEQLAEVGLEVSDPAELARIQIIADAVSVVAVFGPDATPYAIKRRLRCSSCAQVGHVEVWI